MAELRVPQVDFSSLGQLPAVYRKAQAEDLRKQTLANLGQGGQVDADTLLRSGDLSLAQLGMNMQNRQEDRARQSSRDSISDQRWKQEFALKSQQAANGGGVYGTPIYGTDPETGEVVLGAIAKDGRFRRIDTGGVVPTPGGIKPLDTGTGFVPFDPRRGAVVGGAIPKTGEVSRDYAPVVGDNGALSARPIPGTPAAQKIEETEAKRAQSAETTAVGSKAIKEIITDVRGKVASSPWYNPAVGLGAGTAANIPASNAADTAELVKTITANIGFDRLQRMRDESPTGGALGQVAVQELESLQKTIASLSQSQSKGQFLQNLKRVEAQYERINRKAAAYPNAARHGFGPKAAPAASQGATGDLMLQQAKDAIAQGAPRAAVLQRLQEAGIDASGL